MDLVTKNSARKVTETQLAEWKLAHPHPINRVVEKLPSPSRLERMVWDGQCPHGFESWVTILLF
jgi:aspartate carbamoyltransferase catalytic subunit